MAEAAGEPVQRIDTKSFSDCIQALDCAIEAFADARLRTKTEAEKLYGTWEGKGRDAFKKTCGVLLAELSDEEENLGTIRKSLETILVSYETWDSEAASGIRKNELS